MRGIAQAAASALGFGFVHKKASEGYSGCSPRGAGGTASQRRSVEDSGIDEHDRVRYLSEF